MTDLFGGAPPPPAGPARRASAPKLVAATAPAATAPDEKVQAESPPTTQPPHLYGQVTLHDGRQVDSGSAEWRLECLASTLLQLGAAEREAWILGYGTEAARVELRLRIQAVKAARR